MTTPPPYAEENWIADSEPETGAAMRCIERVAGRCKSAAFALDFHTGGVNRNRVRGYAEADLAALAPDLPSRQARLIKAMDARMGFRADAGRLDPLSADGHFREWCVRHFHAPCFTVEFMGLSHFDPQSRSAVPMTQSLLENLGKGLWEVCGDCCEKEKE